MPPRTRRDPFQDLIDEVRRLERDAVAEADPGARARALSRLLAVMAEQVVAVAAERDQAVIELLSAEGHRSHRALSKELGVSRQRVDQLARYAAAGGRPRRQG